MCNSIEKKYFNLQKCKLGSSSNGQTWTIDNIRDGLEYFRDIYGHYPTSREVDLFKFLPSARSIQRTYGGLVRVRKQLCLSGTSDHRKGEVRSVKAKEADSRAKVYEKDFFCFLSKQMAEMRIHEHKVIRPGDVSCDFFIYTSDSDGVVLDLFYAADLLNVLKIINIKYKKYLKVVFPVFFIVVGNENILQSDIDRKVKNKKISLPVFMRVMTEGYFKANFCDIIKNTMSHKI